MKLHEYQSKQILLRYGVPVPAGELAADPEQAASVAQRLGLPVAVKAQVLVGGRGKAGGIRLAPTCDEVRQETAALLGRDINGFAVSRVLVEQAVNIELEIYLGITVDRAAARLVMMASGEGGVEIEQVARDSPSSITKVTIDPLCGLRSYQTVRLCKAVGLRLEHRAPFDAIARALYGAVVATDARLAEINPLVETQDGQLMALDAKIVLDDNALFRHPDLAQLRDSSEESPAERDARVAGMTYVALDGAIGCIVNGAGLAMATMDTIARLGATPANFLDVGGGARSENVALALRLVLTSPAVRSVLVNIFGGITRCDEVANGIVSALRATGQRVPVAARLVGTNEREGRDILKGSGFDIATAETLEDAAQKAIAAAGSLLSAGLLT